MASGRVKITGYYTPDDPDDLDPGHSSGLSPEGYDRMTEQFMGLEELDSEPE